MRFKIMILTLVSFIAFGVLQAQDVENDDMYFNSKDRAKLRAERANGEAVAYASSDRKRQSQEDDEEGVNPTDSYSARNVNPEYTSRANSETAQADNEDYYVYNYEYAQRSQFNNFNNTYDSWYNNQMYSANYFGPSINRWNSPYYGGHYDRWGNPWANPYYRSGWSSSFSYYWGNSYNYGWGMNYGYGNPYYNSMAYNPWYDPYYGYAGYNPYWGGGYYRPTVVVIENNYRQPVYGKRNSRSSQMDREYNRGNNRSNNRGDGYLSDVNNNNNGSRVKSETRQSSEYYNRQWSNQNQQQQQQPQNHNTYSSPNTPQRSSWESNTRSSWRESNNSGSSERSSTYSSPSPSRSSGSSSGGGNSGGGSGSRSSRGRN